MTHQALMDRGLEKLKALYPDTELVKKAQDDTGLHGYFVTVNK